MNEPWTPPEGKVFDDRVGLISRAEKIERLKRFVTTTHQYYLVIPMALLFLLAIVDTILWPSREGGSGTGLGVVFMAAFLLVLVVNLRIDSLVELLKEEGVVFAEKTEEAAPEEKVKGGGEDEPVDHES
jgi:hypothetical protein